MSSTLDKFWSDHKRFVANPFECLSFRMVRDKEDFVFPAKDVEQKNGSDMFHPEYVHQIFGDTERILGYANLSIVIHILASTMQYHVGISYSEKLDTDDVSRVTDIEGALSEYLVGYTKSSDEFLEWIGESKKERNERALYGETIHSYSIESDASQPESDFLVQFCQPYCMEQKDSFHQFYKRLQSLIFLFIDAANEIDLDDDCWDIFITFMKVRGSVAHTPIAFCTTCKYYAYESLVRPRVSQILVLPPYQRTGHGMQLLDCIYTYYDRRDVKDITVEAPNEDYIILRDLVVAKRCSKLSTFNEASFTRQVMEDGQKCVKGSKESIRRAYCLLKMVKALKVLSSHPERASDQLKSLKSEIRQMLYKKYTDDRTFPREVKLQEDALNLAVEETYKTFQTEAEIFMRQDIRE